jgi:hypothetical protein
VSGVVCKLRLRTIFQWKSGPEAASFKALGSRLRGNDGLEPGFPPARERRAYEWSFTTSGTISSATMLMILISGLIAGPAVSL